MIRFKRQHLLCSSLGLNLFLAALLGLKTTGTPSQSSISPVGKSSSGISPRSSPAPKRITTAWDQLYSSDLHDFTVALRFADCPEPIVRNLLTGAINRQFQARKDELRRIDDFWLEGDDKKAAEIQRSQALVELEKQRQSSISQHLQIPWYQDPWLDDSSEFLAFFVSLGVDKAQPTAELFAQAQFEASVAKALEAGFDSPAGLERGREAVRLFSERMAAVLSTQELEELGIRMFESEYFDVWKEQRRFGTKLTGDELREVLRILKPDTLTFFDAPDELQRSQPKGSNRIETGNQLRAVLGDERFAVFLQHHNGDFDQNPGWSDEGKPPPGVYLKLFELQESFSRQLETIAMDPGVSEQEREESTARLLQTAWDTASKLMTPEALNAYLEAGGRWMNPQGVIHAH